MAFSRFAVRLCARAGLFFALLAASAYLVAAAHLYAVAIAAAALAAIQGLALLRSIGRTNRELARFVGAIRYDDLSQSFASGPAGSGFGDLGRAFDGAMRRFREARWADETRRRYLEALVEQVPVALLSLRSDSTVALLNSAARRLLDASSAIPIDALDAYGAAFQRDVAQSRPGGRTLTRTELDGIERRLILSTTQIAIGSTSERLMSLQDIQSELDTNELSAWRDMVRVISHEIMNSLTPISSLARTADEIVADLSRRGVGERGAELDREVMADLRDAVQTLARRSHGLLRFVTTYRQLTQMPPPLFRPIPVRGYLHRLAKLLAAEWEERGVTLHVGEPPESLELLADEGLLDQAMINLLGNAADAASIGERPAVWLMGGVSERGRPVIEVADNGPGLADGIKDKIFLPFFTTKADGSGIGLALARQVMLIHKGAITASARHGGGALFRLTF